MSVDPFAAVKVRKSGRATAPSVSRPRQEEDDDPFAVVQVQRPKAFTQGKVSDVSPLKIGAPSFQQFADAEAELPAAPPTPPKYDTRFAEDVAKRQAKPQPAQPQTSYSLSDMIGRLARTTKAEANRPVEEFQQQVLDVLKAPMYAARQAVPAVSGMAAPFVEGAYNLLGRPDIAEFTRKTQQDIEQSFAPQSAGEAAIGVPLRLAGLFAPYMAAGTTAAPLSLSAALTGFQSQAKDNTPLVEFLGDKLNSDVLKRIAASKYKTPAEMALDITLGLTFSSLDKTVKAFKNTTSARAALRAKGAEPFVQTGNVIREGIQSGELDAKGMAPLLKQVDKFAEQAKVRASLPLSGAGARAVDVVAGLGSSATQFGRNVASNVSNEAKLLGSVGDKLAKEATLRGARVSVPREAMEGDFNSSLRRAIESGDDAEIERLLTTQDEMLSKAQERIDYRVKGADDPVANQFIAMRNKSTRPGFLSPLAPEDLVDKKVTLKHNGTVGFALTPDGDMQNLFNNSGPKGAARELIFDGIRSGGKTLDAFAGYLTDLYRQYGFVETGRLKFNDEFAPAGWNFDRDGRPDVVFMAYRGGEPEAAVRARVNNPKLWIPEGTPAQYFDEYDAAANANKSAADAFQQSRTVGQNIGAYAGTPADAAGAVVRPSGSGGVGGVVEEAVSPATPPAPVVEPVVEAIAEPVKAKLPPITRPEKGPLFNRAPDFGTGSNEYVINADGIEDGWRVWRDTAQGAARGEWYVTPPNGSSRRLTVWTKKEAEKEVLDLINKGRETGYIRSTDNYELEPYSKLVSPRQPSQPITSSLAGKTFDVGGALGEGVSALSNVPGGKAQIAKVGLGGVGYGLSQSEDERLQGHGNALMGLAAYSLVHGKVKQGAKAAGAAVAQELAKSPVGRKVLDEISLDIRVDPRVKETVDVAMREMAKYRAIGRELASEAKARGGVFDRTVSDLVEKEAVEAGTLSPEDMEVAIALAQKVADNSLGLKKVEARLMSADTYAKRGTAYLPRRYAKYDSKDVNDVVVQHKGKTFRIGGEKIRNDALTREERDALGEIREASYRIADYFGRGSKDIATAHLFESLAEIPGVINPDYVNAVRETAIAADLSKVARKGTKAYRGSPVAGKEAARAAEEARARAKALSEQFKRPGQEYVTLPDTPQLGVLRGAVVRKDAADYLNDLPDFKSTNRMYNRLMHYWKSAHTVFNIPATHLTNLTSNVFMGILGGLPIQEQVVAIPRALKDIKEYGPTTRFLTEAGVIERALPTYGDTPLKGLARDETVLRSMMKTTRPETRAALESQGLKPMGFVEESARKVGGKIERAYSLGDTMFRVALFDKLSKQGMTNEDALKEVMRVFPGYDTRSPMLQKLKHVSPFVMYPAKYLPAALNLIAEHPWRWALASATWAAVDQASRRQTGAVDESDLPPNKRFTRAGYLLPGPVQAEALGLKSNEAGKRLMFDVSRFTPVSSLTGTAAPGTMAAALSEAAPAIVQPSGPLVDLFARGAMNVDPFSGQKFIKGSDEASDKLKKWTVGSTEKGRFSPGLLTSLTLPSSLSYHLPNILKDLSYGNEENTKMSMMGLLGGRPVPIKRGQRAQVEQYKYAEKMREIDEDLRGELRAVRDPVIRRSIVKEAMEKRQRFSEEYRKSRQQGKKQ